MLTIGEFSKICRVSPKTLRYYEAIGLLQPRLVNPMTGYRFYAADQLETMRLINHLKAYSFTLEEIKLLVVTLSGKPEDLTAALTEKKQELRRQAEQLTQQLQQLDRDIQNLHDGHSLFANDDEIPVQLTEVADSELLSWRLMVQEQAFPQAYKQCFGTLLEKLQAGTLTMSWAPMVLFHDAQFSDEGLDTEFAVPVAETTPETRLFQPGLCLKTVVSGIQADFAAVYARLIHTAQVQGYHSSGPLFEVYLSDPQDHPETLITEVYYPVTKNKMKRGENDGFPENEGFE